MSLQAFEELAKDNEYGLVRMKILKDFAPYSPNPEVGFAVAGFDPEKALRVYQLGAGIPVDEDLNPLILVEEEQAPPQPTAPQIEIPDDWQTKNRLVRRRYAIAILGEERSLSESEMDEIIQAELNRRQADAD